VSYDKIVDTKRIKPIFSHFQQQLLRNKKKFRAKFPISYHMRVL